MARLGWLPFADFAASGGYWLDEGFCGLDCASYDVAGAVDGRLDFFASALEGFFGFAGEAFGLFLEIVASLFEIVSGFGDAFTELLASLGTGLRGVEEGDGCPCGDSDAEGEPVIFCAH